MDEGGEGARRGEPLGALGAPRDALGVGWEFELHDHNRRRAVIVLGRGGERCPYEGGVAAAGREESDGGQAAAAAVVRKLDVGDGVAFGQEREECYVRKDA